MRIRARWRYAAGTPPSPTPTWTGCDSVDGQNKCTVTMTGNKTVSVSYADVANPTAAFSSPPAKVGPLSWVDANRVRGLLSVAGYADIELCSVDDTVDMGADAGAAYAFLKSGGFVRGALEQVGDDRRDERLARMRALLVSHATADGVLFPASAWLITARRRG